MLLSQSLIQIGHDRSVKKTIRTTLTQALRNQPTLSYEKSVYNEKEDRIYVFADVHSAHQISPILVNSLQQKLENALGIKTELAIRWTLSQTVTAPGNLSQIMNLNLDGEFISDAPNERVLQTQLADTTIRNFMASDPGAQLKFVRILDRDKRLIVVASIAGLFEPEIGRIQEAENILREDLKVPNLDLVIRFQKSTLYDSEGLYQFALTGFTDLTPEQNIAVKEGKNILTGWFAKRPDAALVSLNHAVIDAQIHFLAEVSSLATFEVDRVRELEQRIKVETGESIELHVLSKVEVLTSSGGYEPYEDFVRAFYKTLKPKVLDELKNIIIESAM